MCLTLFRLLYLQLSSKIAASAAQLELSDDDDDDRSVQTSQPPITTPTSSVTGKSSVRSRKGFEDDVLLAAIGERSSQSLQIQEKLVAMLKPPTIPSERQAFADWTRSVMMELEHDVWRRFQLEMTGLMYKFLGENDQR